jgi:general secretion pathway protein J
MIPRPPSLFSRVPKGPKRRARFAGFTLIEILIAVSIFAIVLGAINTVFFSALRLRNRTQAAMDRALPIEQAVSMIKRDLENICIPNGTLTGQLETTPGTNDVIGATTPTFFTSTGYVDEMSPWADVQKVSYTLTESRTNRYQGRDLVRLVSRNLLAQTPEVPLQQWLMGGVQAIGFFFYDGSQWRQYWDGTNEMTKLPRGIKMQIQLAPQIENGQRSALPPLIELVVPMASTGGTNNLSSTAQ